jgi:hypothetical protein
MTSGLVLHDVKMIRPCGSLLVYARNNSDYASGRVDETHRCELDGGHEGAHQCSTCVMSWTGAANPAWRIP